ncbi:hypothetical protein GE061_012083 [Apolygus lucorum]|uniref:MADF domain-containing protein n=1 Tax=Apolygus lucorum TaxID=248454 RepID=A0A8S9XRC9_APOLU|nr:hypothetical protein GE061_012083 [Apolygus lucorum]
MATFPAGRFSTEEDEFLIDFVRDHPILYDMKDTEFKNTSKKDEIWNEAGKVLEKDGRECKTRWKSIRDHYKRGKREEKGSTEKVAKKKRAGYWKRLQFLDSEEDESSLTNVLPSAEFLDMGESQEHEEDDRPNQQSSLRHRSLQLTQTTPPRNTRTSTRSSNEKAVFRLPASETSKERLVIQKYLEEREEDRVNLKRCLERFVGQPLPQENQNDIDLFFKTMAATVKKFRPDLAIKTKASVFKVVTEMELLNQQPNASGSTNIVS